MRKLTEQEKQIVKKISDSEHICIDHLFSEIIKECRISCNFKENEIKIYYLDSRDNKSSRLKIPETAIKELFVIANLLQLLNSEGLVLTFESTLTKTIDDFYSIGNYELNEKYSGYNFGDKRLKKLFLRYVAVDIYPTEDLKYFVRSCYRTQHEIYQTRTLWAAWAGIIVAIGLGLFSILHERTDTMKEIDSIKRKIDSIEQKDITGDTTSHK